MTAVADSTSLEDRSPKTIGLTSNNKENGPEAVFPPSEAPRRGSYPLDTLRETDSNTINLPSAQEADGRGKMVKSHSYNEGQRQPSICLDGIPLGSLTAQEAAKSFWNMDMLHERLQKITECAVQESSSLGSSIESFDIPSQEDPVSEPVTMRLDDESPAVPHTAPPSPRLTTHLSYARSHSAGHRLTSNLLHTRPMPAVKTPPYLSPGATRRVSPPPHFIVTGTGIRLAPRRSVTNLSDDGYYDS